MSAQTTPLTERQRDLITRAHCDAGGLIEPLLTLKGGAKLKMIASLASRHLIEQVDGQWRLTPAAIAIVKGTAQPEEVPPSVNTPQPPQIDDPETEAAVSAAEANWRAERKTVTPEDIEAAQSAHYAEHAMRRSRQNSKQALVIEMLRRPVGATLAQIAEVTQWQVHTTRGFLAGTIKKRLGLDLFTIKLEGCERTYHLG